MNTSKTLRIIDTNVIIEPGKVPDQVSSIEELECAIQCTRFLNELIHNPDSGVVLDHGREILNEYEQVINRQRSKHGFNFATTTAFMNWLYPYFTQRFCHENNVELVDLQKTGENEYAVFPADPALAGFDPPDKKFIAAACAHPEHPPVVEGTDCKWLKYRDALTKYGVNIEFLCPAYIKANYRHKFPGEEPPEL